MHHRRLCCCSLDPQSLDPDLCRCAACCRVQSRWANLVAKSWVLLAGEAPEARTHPRCDRCIRHGHGDRGLCLCADVRCARLCGHALPRYSEHL